MDEREREDAVLRITAQYVEEVRASQGNTGANHRPYLSDYLMRFPQYADEIADFVAYYHAIEADLPQEINTSPDLSNDFRVALNSAWERVLQPQGDLERHSSNDASGDVTGVTEHAISTLLATAGKQRVALSQLAEQLGLSVDIVTKLEQHHIAAASIPREVHRRLAKVLEYPLDTILAYFVLTDQQFSARQQVAEATTSYQVHELANLPHQSFREAVEESENVTAEQREEWFDILAREGL